MLSPLQAHAQLWAIFPEREQRVTVAPKHGADLP